MGSGTIVWLTGGSSGIGRAMAESVPWDGARIVNVSRRPLAGVENVCADLATAEGWATIARSFDRELEGFAGDRAVLVHAAGALAPIGFAGEVDPAAYARCVVLDSAAPQVVGDAFLRALARTRARGILLTVSSGASSHVYEGWSAYGAGKAAVDQWTRTVGAEQARRGGRCRVVAVAPGVVATAMQEEIRATDETAFPAVAKFHELYREGRLRTTAEAARDLWDVALDETLPNGAVIDVRSRG